MYAQSVVACFVLLTILPSECQNRKFVEIPFDDEQPVRTPSQQFSGFNNDPNRFDVIQTPLPIRQAPILITPKQQHELSHNPIFVPNFQNVEVQENTRRQQHFPNIALNGHQTRGPTRHTSFPTLPLLRHTIAPTHTIGVSQEIATPRQRIRASTPAPETQPRGIFANPEFQFLNTVAQPRQTPKISTSFVNLEESRLRSHAVEPAPEGFLPRVNSRPIPPPPTKQPPIHINVQSERRPSQPRFELQNKKQADLEEQIFKEQAENAKYSFASQIDDTLSGNQHQREEVRDGLNVKGMYSYSDGYVKRTVFYEADDKGYRIIKEEVEPLGNGPQVDPHGHADVSTFVSGNALQYSITASDIQDTKKDAVAVAVPIA